MPAPISIIIPTLNAEADLPGTLATLTEGLPSGLISELVISDGGSSDATLAVADAAGAVLVEGSASRGGQLRRGVTASRGAWLLILHADTHLAAGWTEHITDHLRDSPDKAGYFRLGFRARGLMPGMVAGWANLRAAAFGLPYGDQGLLVSRALYDAVGGYPDQPLMEDVAIARALRRRLVMLPSEARTSAARYQRDGWMRRGVRNLWTLTRYRLGASPETLAQAYRR